MCRLTLPTPFLSFLVIVRHFGPTSSPPSLPLPFLLLTINPPPGKKAIDDPSKIVRVRGQDGKTGLEREIAYTNCKVVGNGSFGVVFMAKLVDVAAPSGGGSSGEVGVVKIRKEEDDLKVNKEGGEEEEEGGLTVKEEKVEVVEDIAIKKVLQDKRFKVRFNLISFDWLYASTAVGERVDDALSLRRTVSRKVVNGEHARLLMDLLVLTMRPLLTWLVSLQNRELQIMRIVSHPNVVDLRAFFYSNGDKVRLPPPPPSLPPLRHFRLTRSLLRSWVGAEGRGLLEPRA